MSNAPHEMESLRALESWCRIECVNYPNVEIKNTSTSFRDGLAFCAIIHKHRPDLMTNWIPGALFETRNISGCGAPTLLPDRLSVITYHSQYYCFFTKTCHASLKSSHVTELSKLTKSKPPAGVKPPETSHDHQPGREISQYQGGSICVLCGNHVHLVQRHLAEGHVYHRSCFRCQVCGSTLLPGSYTQGSSTGSLICTHHIAANQSVCPDLGRQIRSAENLREFEDQEGSRFNEEIYSLPHYAGKTESRDRLACRGEDTEGGKKNTRPERSKKGRSKEVRVRDHIDLSVGSKDRVKKPPPPPPFFKEGTPEGAGEAEAKTTLQAERAGEAEAKTTLQVEGAGEAEAKTTLQEEATKSKGPPGLCPASPGGSVSEGRGRPVPAPRRTIDTSTPPVPTPRTKTLQTMNSSSTGNSPKYNKPPPSSSHRSSPAGPSRIVKSNHPWMNMVHSGPWTQLPPAPPPMVPPRTSWFKSRVAPPNPFDEDAEEETNDDMGENTTKSEAVHQSQPENDVNPSNKSAGVDAPAGSSDTGNTATKSKPDGKPKPRKEPSPLQKTATEGTVPPAPEAAQKDSLGENSTNTDAVNQSKPSDTTSPPENDANPSEKTAAEGTAPPTPEDAPKDSLGENSTKSDAVNQSKPSNATSQPENDANPSEKTAVEDAVPSTSEAAQNDSSAGSPDKSSSGGVVNKPKTADKPIAPSVEKSISTGAVSGLGVPGLDELGVPDMVGAAGGLDIKDLAGVDQMGLSGAAGALGTDVTQSLPFPKSASVPAISSVLPTDPPEESESQLTQSKPACEEHPFERKATIPKSKTFQAPPSTRPQAPGFGFPLIKRKVQTDLFVPRGSLQEEMGELDTHLEKLELRGVELEKRLRDCQSGQEEEEMLVDWFRLVQEKHMLVRTDAEQVYLTKQQSLEERQASVEYELRCLLNRPEGEWSQEDKGREQRLMDELVTVIDQRNQVISGLDQDRKREKEEDMLLEAMMRRKDLQREGLKDLRKSKGKFKHIRLLKVLSQKAEKKKS